MNTIKLATIGTYPHGRLDVINDTHATQGLPIKLVNNTESGTWLTPEQVRELRKALKPFAAPKVAKP